MLPCTKAYIKSTQVSAPLSKKEFKKDKQDLNKLKLFPSKYLPTQRER